MKNKKSYFSDSFNMLNLLFISGNWWKPTFGAADTQAPSAPTNLTATAASSSQINLSWTASTDNVGVTGYRVFRGGVQVGTPTGTSYIDTSLTASTAYSYTVKAIDAAGFEASKATDGSSTTRWASLEGSNNEWIYVDLGAAASINRVKLNWEAAYGKGYKIQVSTDNTTWTDAFVTTTGNGGIDNNTFTAKNGRYVRVLCTARGTTYGYSLFDFEVYGS